MVRNTWLVISILFLSVQTYGSPSVFVYQGQILDEFAIPVEEASVTFKIQVYSPMPSKCLLFEENFSPVNMSNSNGIFALPIGTGTTTPSSHYSDLKEVFDNEKGSITPTVCEGVATYDATAGDLRYIRVTFNKGAGDIVVPDRPMYSAPFALNSQKVGGLERDDILQVNEVGANDLSQVNLEWVFDATRYTELQNLINGTSTQYLGSTPASAPNFNGQVLDNIATPADGNDATNKNYVDSRLGGQVVNATVSSPGAAQDGYALVWNNTTSQYELVEGSSALGDHLGNHTATTNLILGSNFLSNDGAASQGLSFDGSNTANFSQNLTVSQGFSVTNGVTSAGPINLNNQQELRLQDLDSSNFVALKAAGTTTADYSIELPASAPGGAGLILRTNGSGNLSWTSDTVTSVFTRSGDVTAQNGDYTASQVTNVVAGDIAAVTVQAAINELDSEKFNNTGDSVSGNVVLENERELRFSESSANGINYVALKAPALLGGSFTYEFPVNYGSNGDILTSNGGGLLTWVAPTGGTITSVIAGTGLGGGTITTTGTISLADTAVTAGSYGSSSEVSVITVDAQGRLTSASDVNIDHDALSNFVADEHVAHTGVLINTNSGSGLTGGGSIAASRSLQVQVDDSSVEIATNTIRVKALGVGNSHLAADAVSSAKIANDTILNTDISPSAAIVRSKIASGNNNRILINNGSGQFSEASAIASSRALASDGSGLPVASAVTSTELGYVSGVTSSIQTQLNAKQNGLGYTPINDAGDTMAGALGVVAGTAAAPGLNFSGDTNTGLFSSGGDTISITTAGTEAIFVNASGEVGIGTGLPRAKLDVEGGIQLSDDGDACSATKEGTVRFNTTTKRLQVCDGTTWALLGGALQTSAPAGSVSTLMTAACPAGYLQADGSAVSRSTYSTLFAALGVMYGNGDGSTTFNLPDMRGYFVRGVDGSSGNDPDAASRTDRGDGTTGDNVGTKQDSMNASHLHGNGTLGGSTSTDGDHAHAQGTLGGSTSTTGDHLHGNGTLGGTASTAGNHSHAKGTLGGSTSTAGNHSHTVRDYYRATADADGGDGANAVGGLTYSNRTTNTTGNHSHSVSITGSTATTGNHSHSISMSGSIANAGNHNHSLSITGNTATTGNHGHSLSITGSMASDGGSESRPKNIAALYCVKY